MSQLGLARLQFGITTIYHFFFVPVTIGMAVLLAILESMYVATGNEEYKTLTKFWGKLFLINFAVGVVTGILQEFQFGLDWANYSRFVGDIFGAPLAIEALAAFFLESTFIGIWQFGWEQVSKKVHLVAIWMVALGTTLSGFWILTANSFMQEPVGYMLVNGKAEMKSFGDLLTNPQLWVEFPHTITAAYLTASVFMLAISAYQILHKRNPELFKKSFKLAAVAVLITGVAVATIGDQQATHLVTAQPMKIAAAEAIWHNTSDHAPWTVIGIVDSKTHQLKDAIQIPDMLSILAYKRLSGSLQGINTLQAQDVSKYGAGNYVPPVAPTFYAFRVMILMGVLMILAGLWATIRIKGEKFLNNPRMLKVLIWTLPMPYIANSAGWIMTEVGRQPWVVYGLLSTAKGVSPAQTVPALDIWTSLVLFSAIYTALAVAAVFLFKKYTDLGATPAKAPVEAEGDGYLHVI
ncbi:MAG: cytochrome ubiquinol oxidase subunit I [Sulfobacillus benefaciens]|uniref:Cytochrome ubiquinol oxidase subunit I n=1 Tax=Sulfobacillus benefaciens TaxID=453960 RepID=A0A2T2XC02_9FIRM|nr:MAG: cytochrome ubiquinol oxidase subunit I [Sulfobacillus benefaciens]